MLVAMCFGLDPSWGMLTVPFINFVAGFGWSPAPGIAIAGFLKGIENFNYVTSAVITPLFLVRGHVLPARPSCRSGSRCSAQLNPLYHCRRARAARRLRLCDALDRPLALVATSIGFGLLMWRLAIHAMQRKLVD